jgi:hypothetical protein
MRFYLLTHHGRFLCRARDGGGFGQVGWNDLDDRAALFSIDVDPSVVGRDYAAFVADAEPRAQYADVLHLGRRTIEPNPAKRTISLVNDGDYLSALPDGRVTEDKATPDAFESLVPVSDADLDVLATVLTNEWIVRSNGELVRRDRVGIGPGQVLWVGALQVPLAFNLPFDAAAAPFRFTMLNQGWRLDEIVLYRPLIYYTAFGRDPFFAQLHVSLESLMRIGRYDGDVLVLTDRTHAEICAAVPCLRPERVRIVAMAASDRAGSVMARYSILDVPGADRFQPLLYVDADIVWNAGPVPLLIDAALSERMAAPIEVFNRLADSPSVGATLLQIDNAQPRFACGFNNGTFSIPNLPAHRPTLVLIRQVIANLMTIFGRDGLRWVDQEAANYVSYRRAHFDTVSLSRYVRYGGAEAARDGTYRTGLVHFWSTTSEERADIMRQYLDLLLEQDGLPR